MNAHPDTSINQMVQVACLAQASNLISGETEAQRAKTRAGGHRWLGAG